MNLVVSKLAKVLVRNWWELTLICVALLIAVPAYQEWSKKHDREVREEATKAAQNKVGLTASAVGALMWGAYKKCRALGLPDLDPCAKHSGPLVQDKTAPMLAQVAIKQREAYEEQCEKLYAKEYCFNLLSRAFDLSQNEP